jgi:hypothetical protein
LVRYLLFSILDHLTSRIGEQTLSELTAVFNPLELKFLADQLA